MPRGPLVVLALAAVLSGAPSPASAAGGAAATVPTGNPNTTDVTLGPVAIGIGIGGIVAMALFAWLVPLARLRRRIEAGSSKADNVGTARRAAAEEQVTAALHRRTLRRARVRLEEDPIIASMGVGSPSRAEPGIRRARRTARRSPPT